MKLEQEVSMRMNLQLCNHPALLFMEDIVPDFPNLKTESKA
jgi:hypothetical protein